MSTDLGAELPQRSTVMWILVGTAVIFLVPTWRMVRSSVDQSGSQQLGWWAMTAAIALLLVVLPLWIARTMSQRHYYVSPDRVTWLQGERIRMQMRFEDVDRVLMRYDGGLGASTPEWFNDAVVLVGRDQDGRERHLRVSRVFVTTLHPLLERVAEDVARRPALMEADDRAVLEGRLAEQD